MQITQCIWLAPRSPKTLKSFSTRIFCWRRLWSDPSTPLSHCSFFCQTTVHLSLKTFYSGHSVTSAQALCTSHAESAALQTVLSVTGTDAWWQQGSSSFLVAWKVTDVQLNFSSQAKLFHRYPILYNYYTPPPQIIPLFLRKQSSAFWDVSASLLQWGVPAIRGFQARFLKTP